MRYPSNLHCAIGAGILQKYGVKDVVICPGSRNIPLVKAFTSRSSFTCHSVIDEREAGFFALGLSQGSQRPVAIVCTSGSALLDVSPAIAEAYYKKLPLILVSADRPEAWIDQEDSQTIRQNGILENVVRGSFVLPEIKDDEDYWVVERTVNKACICADGSIKGPVHINVPISYPLSDGNPADFNQPARKIDLVPLEHTIPGDVLRTLGSEIQATGSVLIAVSSLPPSASLSNSLKRLAALPNVFVVYESLSNLHIYDSNAGIDRLIKAVMRSDNDYLPDILITCGGPFISRLFKEWIRDNAGSVRHWHVSPENDVIDTFRCLEKKIVLSPQSFFSQLRKGIRHNNKTVESGYAAKWKRLNDALCCDDKFFDTAQWCDLSALRYILGKIPTRYNIQLSNGMAVRYFESLNMSCRFHRVDCNRGVSGIDGSTSTAIGASAGTSVPTLLISGDMSARYDISGFMDAPCMTKNFKMIIFENGGGNIFKVINPACWSDVMERYVKVPHTDDWSGIGAAMGWKVYEVSDSGQLVKTMSQWLSTRQEPSLLVLHTSADVNVEVYRRYIDNETD